MFIVFVTESTALVKTESMYVVPAIGEYAKFNHLGIVVA